MAHTIHVVDTNGSQPSGELYVLVSLIGDRIMYITMGFRILAQKTSHTLRLREIRYGMSKK